MDVACGHLSILTLINKLNYIQLSSFNYCVTFPLTTVAIESPHDEFTPVSVYRKECHKTVFIEEIGGNLSRCRFTVLGG